ncbi:MAG: hypothetical protein RR562_08230 [Longicatena sp.]
MNIEKRTLAEIKRCYCASSLPINHTNHIVFASEDPNVGCEMFALDTLTHEETIWKEAGGCMSIIAIPGKENEFLAVQEFYLKVSPSLAKIVWGKYGKDGFEIKDVLAMPYIHRFDIYHANGVNYFIGATIATSKESKDDWSVPGRIYVAQLPEDLSKGIEVEVLVDGLFRNHGYWKDMDENCGYFGSDQGILKVMPPKELGGQWRVESVLQGEIGEIATVDIDGDGNKEIMTIEPFHGNTIKIYKKVNGKYTPVYTYENEIDFAHTLVGGTLGGTPTFIAGVRRCDAELFYVQYKDGKYVSTCIEKGVGPANIALINEEHRDVIVAANHTKNEAAVYIVTKEG